MEKKISKRKMLRRKYKHYAAALAGVAIIAGTTLHGVPLNKAEAAVNPVIAPLITTEQTTLNNKDVKKPIVETNTIIDSLASPDKVDNSDKKTETTPDQGDKKKDDRDRSDKPGQRDHRYDHKRYDHEKWADRHQDFHQRMVWYNNSLNKIQIYNVNASPVDIVMAAADGLGFNVNYDTFSLISQTGSQSIVRVIHNGNNYDITVDHLSNGNWQVSLLQQIL